MNLTIRGKNKLEITAALRNYIEERVSSLAGLFNPRQEINVNVLCKVYEKFQSVEITIPTKHLILRAESQADIMYTAVDLAVDKIERQLKRHKNKINTMVRKREGVASYFSEQFNKQTENDSVVRKLVRNKELAVQRMTVDEAILQMELLEHDFFVFINEKNHRFTVLYLRNDGDYATLEIK